MYTVAREPLSLLTQAIPGLSVHVHREYQEARKVRDTVRFTVWRSSLYPRRM